MSKIAIKVEKLVKIYRLYDRPIDRMKEALSFSRKKYSKEHYALNNISFEIKKGETVGILGSNGSGKSTILKIITGVLTQTSGDVTVNGKISALLELGAGFNPEYTGLENIYLNGTMMGYSREQMKKKVNSILEFADIGEFIYQPVKTYSSGMFARLAFAVAINVEPEILIVDEALSVGDTRFQIKCMNRMKQMMEGGTTVLFVSHDTNAIRRFCTKAIWLNKGEMMKMGDVNQIADEYLDFLKFNESMEKSEKRQLPKDMPEIEPFKPGENIAEIVDFRIFNENYEEVNNVRMDKKIKIRVTYDVYDEKINKPVLGIAIRSIADDYVCGLNTLLDRIEIPWKYGRNVMELEYIFGILAMGGKYYFDVALFEETATVQIQYKSRIKELTVSADYIGEGTYIIPHLWIGGEKYE
ncbi:lipopolysaccharide transport system ATP-binding protein [Clostridium neonatale]|uniref:ABC transporter ATP-binding protein n=1 Tax=Clostridium neonatale TaxID=137838 RepID=UPI00291B8274|nr:ABC transporter ATP-binding protein [Clostridium neonatale]CAI3633684.1 lipopolysaccharide transport system ATP-binding protein [Clostridium neonatale]